MKYKFQNENPKGDHSDAWLAVCVLGGIFGSLYGLAILVSGDFKSSLILFIYVFFFCWLCNSMSNIMKCLKKMQEQIEELKEKLNEQNQIQE